jgi:hypothetical protein
MMFDVGLMDSHVLLGCLKLLEAAAAQTGSLL